MYARWLKLFVDGSLGSRSAALLASYVDAATNPPTGGRAGWSSPTLTSCASALSGRRSGVVAGEVHAIGDAAVRTALDVLERHPARWIRRCCAASSTPIRSTRPTDHAFGDTRRRCLGPAGPSAQRPRAGAARRGAVDRRTAFPLRTMVESGALLPFGTDAPVEAPIPGPASPWPWRAVQGSRSMRASMPIGADQAISVERAIRAAVLDPRTSPERPTSAGCSGLCGGWWSSRRRSLADDDPGPRGSGLNPALATPSTARLSRAEISKRQPALPRPACRS